MSLRLPRIAAVVLVLLVVVGCANHTPLPVTPNVLADGSGTKVLEALPPQLHKTQMEILYVSDRDRSGTTHAPIYGYKRSRTLSYGVATVSVHPDTDFDSLAAEAGKPDKSDDRWLNVASVTEAGQFAPTLTLMEAHNGVLRLSDAGRIQREAEIKTAQEFLMRYISAVPDKDVYLYVHGFNNSFDDAVLRLAGVWHHLGRKGVAVAYTWPAGHGGLFGYFYDRESGEYTVFRLKQTIRAIAECPAVERLHIIAHSRGTDVTVAALRELTIEVNARGQDPRQALKLQSLVLAAPDIDTEIFIQRFVLENLATVANRVVIYASPDDSALGWAMWLFRGGTRLGATDMSKIAPAGQKLLQNVPSLQLVDCRTHGFASSHAYVFTNPAALSDLILVLRDGKDAGAAKGRPLTPEGNTWRLEDDYLRPPKKP